MCLLVTATFPQFIPPIIFPSARGADVSVSRFRLNLVDAKVLSRIHAVGQASRLSLTLNDRLEAWFRRLTDNH